MPKKIPQNELDAILEAVSQFPEGASVKDLSETLDKKLSRRTSQRRLAYLVDQKRLAIARRGRGTRYQIYKNTIKADIVLPFIELNAAKLIMKKGKGKRIAVVGHFPFIPMVRGCSKELWVTEKTPKKAILVKLKRKI